MKAGAGRRVGRRAEVECRGCVVRFKAAQRTAVLREQLQLVAGGAGDRLPTGAQRAALDLDLEPHALLDAPEHRRRRRRLQRDDTDREHRYARGGRESEPHAPRRTARPPLDTGRRHGGADLERALHFGRELVVREHALFEELGVGCAETAGQVLLYPAFVGRGCCLVLQALSHEPLRRLPRVVSRVPARLIVLLPRRAPPTAAAMPGACGRAVHPR